MDIQEAKQQLQNFIDSIVETDLPIECEAVTDIKAMRIVLSELQKLEKVKQKIEQKLNFCKNDSNGEKICQLQIRFYEKLLNILEE